MQRSCSGHMRSPSQGFLITKLSSIIGSSENYLNTSRHAGFRVPVLSENLIDLANVEPAGVRG